MKTLFWAAIFLIGGTWLWLAADAAAHTVTAVVVIIAGLGFFGLRGRFRNRRRKAVLDLYADREIARAVALQTLKLKGR
jgi:hypothetical protein